jgi:Flp pilus assembly protein TadB
LASYGKRQRAEGRGQRAEGRRQKAEGRRQKAEGRRQKAEGRRQKAEGRRQKAEGRRQKAEGFYVYYWYVVVWAVKSVLTLATAITYNLATYQPATIHGQNYEWTWRFK